MDRKMADDAESAQQKEPWRIASIEFIEKHGGEVTFNVSDSVSGYWKAPTESERRARQKQLAEEAEQQGLPYSGGGYTPDGSSGEKTYSLSFKRPESQRLKLPWQDSYDTGSYL
jgi:hypothetical protein